MLRETRGIESVPFEEAALAVLAGRGMSAEVGELLAAGYPTAPLQIGTLTFFPSREHFAQVRRFPELFFIAEAWRNPRQVRKRARVEHDDELLDAACDFVRHVPEGDVFGREQLRANELVFWLPRVERALESELTDERADRVLQILGGAIRWDDYRAEIDKRLLFARSFFLVGLLIALYLLTRNGSLPGRLAGSGAALLVVGVGLGLAPWLRENARLRDLEQRD